MERIKEEELNDLFKQPDKADKLKRLEELEKYKQRFSKEEFAEVNRLRDELNNGKRMFEYIGPCPDQGIKVDHTNWGKSISQAESQDISDTEDHINTPGHYHQGGFDVITILEKKFGPIMSKGFFLGNVLKYVMRYQSKGGVDSLMKAKFYLDALIDNENGQAYEQKTKGE